MFLSIGDTEKEVFLKQLYLRISQEGYRDSKEALEKTLTEIVEKIKFKEKAESRDLFLNSEEALDLVLQQKHVTFVIDLNDVQKPTMKFLRKNMDEEEFWHIFEEGNEFSYSIFLTNGEYAEEEAKKILLMDEWDRIILNDQKNPVDENRYLVVHRLPF